MGSGKHVNAGRSLPPVAVLPAAPVPVLTAAAAAAAAGDGVASPPPKPAAPAFDPRLGATAMTVPAPPAAVGAGAGTADKPSFCFVSVFFDCQQNTTQHNTTQ